jgi:large subunit ribosomal protein L20
MTRVKRGAVARQRRKKILSLARGAIGSNSSLFRIANQHVIKALSYAYQGRRKRKRQYRSLWMVRVNARVRIHGWNYSSFFNHIYKKKYLLNRKILAQIAVYDPETFLVLISLTILIMSNFFKKTSSFYQKRKRKTTHTAFIINYKNVGLLRRFIGTTGKIIPRRITKLPAPEHRAIAKAIRQARRVGFLPFVWFKRLINYFYLNSERIFIL